MRKNEMKQLDLTREKNLALSDLELEAKEKAEHLLSRANAMRLEQEDEIKHLNEVGCSVCVCVYVCLYNVSCVCVCVRERERERKRESACVCLCMHVYVCDSCAYFVCVFVCV